jgi:hypothetical protein
MVKYSPGEAECQMDSLIIHSARAGRRYRLHRDTPEYCDKIFVVALKRFVALTMVPAADGADSAQDPRRIRPGPASKVERAASG